MMIDECMIVGSKIEEEKINLIFYVALSSMQANVRKKGKVITQTFLMMDMTRQIHVDNADKSHFC